MIKLEKGCMEGGKRSYHVMSGLIFLGMIRFYRATDQGSDGHNGWTLLYVGGRIERYDTLAEAKDAALKM